MGILFTFFPTYNLFLKHSLTFLCMTLSTVSLTQNTEPHLYILKAYSTLKATSKSPHNTPNKVRSPLLGLLLHIAYRKIMLNFYSTFAYLFPKFL